ncbi:MFS transporter [Streptomyces sp. NPDC059909]|uniref:MFS transporter n=1 Tax=Streptomyces sp. NPDC059909 TaxID=3346998 RepID=UPI0036591450
MDDSEPRTQHRPDAEQQPDPRRWRALALLCAADFMVILDAQIVILALPSIQRDLGFPGGGEQWVMSAYLLAFGGLLLLGGRSADLLGRRRMFMAGTALFLVSSLLCGFAWTGGVLIVARVLQGISAAIMAPTALSILMTTFAEGSERNKALGIWSAVGGIGATAALLIGGPLTSWLGWEWIFFINVPVALALFGLSPVLLRESRALTRERHFDLAGAVTVTAALALLVYAVVEAPHIGWSHGRTVGLLCLSALLIAVFALVESRSAAPLAPLRIFRSRALVGGNLVLILLGMAAWGMSLTVSQYAQQVLGYSALLFGLSTAVMPVMAAVGSVAGQAVVTRTGPRSVAVVGMALTGIGCLLLTQVATDGSYFGDIFLGLLVFGPGLGAAFVAASVASLAGVAEQESGLASGLNTASFQIGGAFGVAVLSTVAVPRTGAADPLAALTEGFRTDFAASIGFSAAGLLVALLLLGRARR